MRTPRPDALGRSTHSTLLLTVLLALVATGCEPVEDDAPPAPEPAALATSGDAAGTGAPPEDEAPGAARSASDPEARDAPAGGGTPELVASVNDTPIPLADFQLQAFDTQRFFVEQGIDPGTEDGQRQLLYLRRQVLDDMINQALIEQAADEMGITADADEAEASLAEYVDSLGGESAFEASLSEAGTTRDDVLMMERANLIGRKVLDAITADVPTVGTFRHARHILCEAAADCLEAANRLEAGEDFEAVAAEVSIDDLTAERGGDLDWVVQGMLASRALEDALFELEVGERSDVIQSEFGYHVIEVLEEDRARELSEDQRFELREKRLLDWLAERRAASDIVIYIDDLREPLP